MGGLEDVKDNKLLYHLTKLDNFRSIVQNGLLSREMIQSKRLLFYDVADPNIINRRAERGLDNYIPFHFHPYTAFDYAVKNYFDSRSLIYLCIYRSYAKAQNFKILPRHPLSMDSCQLYEYNEGFDMIDWNTMTMKNSNTNYVKEVKMAECLANRPIHISELSSIFVPSDSVESEIENILNDEMIPMNQRPVVYKQPLWFDLSE